MSENNEEELPISDIASKTAPRSRFSVREICYSGLFAAVIAIMAQISIPMPGGVPMTMQTFAITLAAVVLGAKLSTVSSVIYLLLGAVGVPVLANFSGGFDKFIGPTGGFLISFPLMAFIIGWGADHRHAFRGAYVLRTDRRHDCQLCCRHGDVLRTHEQLDRRRRDRMRAAVHPDRYHQGCSCNRDRLSRSQAHPGAQGMIRLRPHHLLCTQGYSGKGYSTNCAKYECNCAFSTKCTGNPNPACLWFGFSVRALPAPHR